MKQLNRDFSFFNRDTCIINKLLKGDIIEDTHCMYNRFIRDNMLEEVSEDLKEVESIEEVSEDLKEVEVDQKPKKGKGKK